MALSNRDSDYWEQYNPIFCEALDVAVDRRIADTTVHPLTRNKLGQYGAASQMLAGVAGSNPDEGPEGDDEMAFEVLAEVLYA